MIDAHFLSMKGHDIIPREGTKYEDYKIKFAEGVERIFKDSTVLDFNRKTVVLPHYIVEREGLEKYVWKDCKAVDRFLKKEISNAYNERDLVRQKAKEAEVAKAV